MALGSKKTKINGAEYTIQIMDGDRALSRIGTLSKFLGGPLGRLLASGMKKASDAAPELVAGAFAELGQHLASDEFRELVYDMLEGSFVQPKGVKDAIPLVSKGNIELFKGHFAGDMGSLFQLVWFALKENYGNFFDAFPGLGGLVQLARAKAQAQLSQQDTTGGSQGS